MGINAHLAIMMLGPPAMPPSRYELALKHSPMHHNASVLTSPVGLTLLALLVFLTPILIGSYREMVTSLTNYDKF